MRDSDVMRFGWLLLGLSLTAGCRWVSGSDETARRRPAVVAARKETGDDWKDGRLPASMLEGTPHRGGELVVQMDAEPPSLNTLVDSDWWAGQITEHRIYDSLVSVDPYDHPQYRPRPALAERWEISPDRRTYTFWLRRDVTWHDGTPFGARDVVATFDKIQDPTTKCMHVRAYSQELQSYRALDEYTVEFQLKKPYFLAMDGLFVDVPIQPAHVIGRLSGTEYNEAATNPLNRHPIGTGPFRFVRWESNQQIVLERSERYWARPPYVDRLVFRIVKELTVALELAERQELDVVPRVRGEAWANMDEARFRPSYHRSLFYDSNYAWIGYNQKKPLLADVRVRQALTLLVDRPGIINSLQYGLAKPTTCHFYWASEACDPSIVPWPYDPVRATKLLDEAGYVDHDGDGLRDKGGVVMRFGLMFSAGSEDAARMATMMKEQLWRAGIELRTERVEWSSFVRRLREREFDACTLMWAGGGPRSDPTQTWHSSSIGGGSNYIGFSSPRADALMEQARGELSDDRRNALYREFGRLLDEEQPYTWLYVRPRLALIHRRVKGAKVALPGWQYEDWWLDGERRSARKVGR
jgi:peptide/nickel transport system substrate-binding protein